MNAAMRLQAHSGNSALQAQSKSPAQPVVLIVLSRGPIRENKKQTLFGVCFVSGNGLEPSAFAMSTQRSNQLS